jgi:hypothetical protein
MIKRKIYKSLTIVTIIVNIFLSYLIVSLTHREKITIPAVFILVYLMELILQLFIGLILMMCEKVSEPTDLVFPNLGFLTFRFKRIYYSDLGYFWCWKKSDNRVIIYKQSYFYMKKLFSIFYYGDNNQFAKKVKKELEEIYKEELNKKRQSDSFKNWNGYIDKVSEIDAKLNDLGV